MGPVVVALGGHIEHRCACGMVRGKCGCPECERLEKQRQEDREPQPYAVLKSNCDDDDDFKIPSTAIPRCVVPQQATEVRKPFESGLATQARSADLESLERQRPPIPPPRCA